MYFQQHTLLDFWKICQIYVKQSHLNSYILQFTVHFIPVKYVFHPASAEIEFVKDCLGYAPKKQNTARAAPEDSESLWGRWRRLPVCGGYSWSEPVDSKIHSSEIHSRGKDRGKTAWWPKQRQSRRRNAELPRRRELSAHFVADKPRATKTAAKQAIHTWLCIPVFQFHSCWTHWTCKIDGKNTHRQQPPQNTSGDDYDLVRRPFARVFSLISLVNPIVFSMMKFPVQPLVRYGIVTNRRCKSTNQAVSERARRTSP